MTELPGRCGSNGQDCVLVHRSLRPAIPLLHKRFAVIPHLVHEAVISLRRLFRAPRVEGIHLRRIGRRRRYCRGPPVGGSVAMRPQRTAEPTRSVLRESTIQYRLMWEWPATSQAAPSRIVSADPGSGVRDADPDSGCWRRREYSGAGRVARETWRCNRIRE